MSVSRFRVPQRKHFSASKEEGEGRGEGVCWTQTSGKRIFHMLHHGFAEGQRVSLIKREITPELKVMRCRHIATFLPRALREMQRFSVEDLQTESHDSMCLTDVRVVSFRCLFVRVTTGLILRVRGLRKYLKCVICDDTAAYLPLCVRVCRSVEYGRTWLSLLCDSCSRSRCASACQHQRGEEKKWRGRSSNTGRCLPVLVGDYSVI